jgi:hypothetical protein
MRILIYTTHRTGSTALAEFLMSHYDCDYHRGSLIQPPPDNIIIKVTPTEFKYEIVRYYFDKVIILLREDTKQQAESRIYADLVEKKFEPYVIDQQFLNDHENEIAEMSELIIQENEYLKKCEDSLVLTYEETYYSDNGLLKLEEYLGTKFKFRINNGKKYRDGKKTLV